MSHYESRLRNSIDKYQQAAEDLEAELVKAFHKLRKKTGKELWRPLNCLQNKDDVPKLYDVIKEINENIERLRWFDPEENSKRPWDKVKRGISKFVRNTLPALTNFMIATKDAQSIPLLNPYGVICGGLLFLISVAEADAKRKQNFLEELKGIGDCLDFLDDVNCLPDEYFSTDDIQSKAFELMAATLELVMKQVKYLATSLGGRMVNQLTTKNQDEYELAREALQAAVREYDTALDQGHRKMDAENLSITKSSHNMLVGTATTVSRVSESLMIVSENLQDIKAFYLDNSGRIETRGLFKNVTRQAILDWLSTLDYDATHKATRANRVEGTGLWLVNHDNFQAWFLGKAPHSLYCPGLPGSGKTVITSIVIDHIEDKIQGENIGICYAYFDYKNQARQTALNIVASLVKQLVSYVDDILPELYHIYQTFRSRDKSLDFDDLSRVLQAVSKVLRTSFIVLDALDECEKKQRWILLDFVSQLPASDFKIFTTSRPYLRDIQEHFDQVPKIDIVSQTQDIRAYIKKRLDRELTRSPGLKTEIVETISINANGLFLLGQTQLNYVLQFKDPKNKRKALKESISTELFDLYESIMQNCTQQFNDSPTIFRLIISWIYYAKRPLKMEELREAIVVRDEGDLFDADDLIESDDIVDMCGSLVMHEKETDIVRFSHEKVQEFIQKRHIRELLPELDLVAASIEFLLLDDFSIGPVEDETSFQNRVQKHPFVLYAAGYWSAHVKSANAEGDEDVQNKLARLSNCQAKIDSLFQMQQAGTGNAWEKVQKSWQRGASILHLFAENGLLELARLVLTKPNLFLVIWRVGFANIQATDDIPPTSENLVHALAEGFSPLHFAARKGHAEVIKLLIDFGAEIELCAPNGRSPLILAAYLKDIRAISLLLDAHAEVSVQDKDGWTAFHVASESGHVETIKLFLDAHADVAVQNKDGWTALHLVSQNGHVEAAKLLLDAHADVAVQTHSGWTALHLASQNGHVEAVKLLLERHADVAVQSKSGWTALHSASQNGHVETVKLLLDAKAHVTIRTQEGYTPLHSASWRGHVDVVKLLLDAQADVAIQTQDGYTALHCASQNGHVKVVKLLLDAHADVAIQDKYGWTALHRASCEGHVEVVKLLLEAHSDVAVEQRNGWTPLRLASWHGHVETVKLLLDTHADVTIQDEYGWTALHSSAWEGHVETVRLLLDANADVSVRCMKGRTALHCASENGKIEVVRLLLDAHADVAIQCKYGWTALHSASMGGHVETVKMLLDAHADLAVQNQDGLTALHFVSLKGHVEATKLLLDAHADMAIQDKNGLTALHYAAGNGHVEVVRLLLDAHADMAIQSEHGQTALHEAASSGHVEVVKMLLDAHADVNVQDNDGWTALHVASKSGHVEAVKLLVDAHADVAIQGNEGWTALHVASWDGHWKLFNLLCTLDSIHPDSLRPLRFNESINIEDSLSLFDSVVRMYPVDIVIRRAIGNEYFRRKMFSEAKHSFDASVHILLQREMISEVEGLRIEGIICDHCRDEIRGYYYKSGLLKSGICQ